LKARLPGGKWTLACKPMNTGFSNGDAAQANNDAGLEESEMMRFKEVR
jgi:hypothetical protein